MNSTVSNSVEWILREFLRLDIAYAVLRNHEKLPQISHDLDLICHRKEIEKIRSILFEAKEIFHWDELFEVDLWNSFVDDYAIKVFKFFDYETRECLQIDFFGGYTICSAPAISVASFLSKREQEKFYFKISPRQEILMRSMQLACAIRDNQKTRVVKLQQVIEHLGGIELLKGSYKDLKSNLDIGFLAERDVAFQRGFEKFKKKFLLLSFLKKPGVTALRFFERLRFRIKLAATSMPGVFCSVSRVVVNTNLEVITAELDAWVKGNIVTGYFILERKSPRNTLLAYKVLRSGGLVLNLVSNEHHSPNVILDFGVFKRAIYKKYRN